MSTFQVVCLCISGAAAVVVLLHAYGAIDLNPKQRRGRR
jgi:hypothetical protein